MKTGFNEGGRPAQVLLAEDTESDVILTRESFERAKFHVEMSHVENGEDCLAFLRREGRYRDAPVPDLLLLDLNMPVMDGREVLSELVKDESLKHLPVVVLTTSEDERDILAMYQLRCNAYVTKPVDFVRFHKIVQELTAFWFTVVVLPESEDARAVRSRG
jgi:CheY-like chemotaxis protein